MDLLDVRSAKQLDERFKFNPLRSNLSGRLIRPDNSNAVQESYHFKLRPFAE